MTDPGDMRVLGLIPARGGSKAIAHKNLAPLAGRPLIAYTIEAALASRRIGRTVVSTDAPAIAAAAVALGAEAPFRRPARLAADDTPMLPVVRHAVEWLANREGDRPAVIVLLQPTSPLRTARHIDEALERLLRSDADSVVSVVPVPHRFTPEAIMRLENGLLVPHRPMDETRHLRQLRPAYYARNGAAIYAFTRECLMEKNSLYGDRILPYPMPPEASVDVDAPFDLELCRLILENRGRVEDTGG